jgi:hypothetical protein
MGPNFGCANYPDCESDTPPDPNYINNVGLAQTTYASYLGLRVSQLRSSRNHTWKVGLDVNRSNSSGSQTYACYYVACALPSGGVTPPVATPYSASSSSQAQAGSQIGIYAQDKWQASITASVTIIRPATRAGI